MGLPALPFESFLRTIPDAVFIVDQEARIAFANYWATMLFGYQPGELDGRPVEVLVAQADQARHTEQVAALYAHPIARSLNTRTELYAQRKDGSLFPADIWLNPIETEDGWITLCVLLDISQRKELEQALRDSEAQYHSLSESLVEGYAYCHMIYEDDQPVDWVFVAVNAAFEHLTNLVDIVGRRVTEAIPGIRDSDPELFEIYGRVASSGNPERFETFVAALKMWFDFSVYSPQPGYFVAVFDVTTKRKEAAESLMLFRRLIDQSNDAIEVIDPATLRFIDVNQRAREYTGFSRQELLELTVPDIEVGIDPDRLREIGAKLRQSGSLVVEGVHRRKDGSSFPVEISLSYARLEREYFVGIVRDIAERKKSAERLELFRALIDQSNDAIEVVEPDSARLLDVNHQALIDLGYTRDEYLSLTVFDINPEIDAEQFEKLTETLRDTGTQYVQGLRRRKDGSTFSVEVSLTYARLDQGYIISVARDITERKKRQHELETIAEVGAALRVADGLDEMRPIILQELLSILGGEGAVMATADTGTGEVTIDLGAGAWSDLTGKRLRPGDTIVGQVMRSGELFVSNLVAGDPSDPLPKTQVPVMAVAAIPLEARGGIIGALALGRATSFASEDLRLLTSFGDMVASSVRRVSLREQAERDALELSRAYESTIAGWSRALDLRDHGTEGHTERVTELTLRLARAAGLPEDELAHVRRGALLHDIGKMGIPDAILLKDGPLSDSEWDIMRQHPVNAFSLLLPIEYLWPALDIPYCHHEKWDGTGYPRGLEGEAIPSVARLFALADVWDALLSDRPYRKAWPEARVAEYIRDQSGIHFDPKAVELFFRVIER